MPICFIWLPVTITAVCDYIHGEDDTETIDTLWSELGDDILAEHVKHKPHTTPWAASHPPPLTPCKQLSWKMTPTWFNVDNLDNLKRKRNANKNAELVNSASSFDSQLGLRRWRRAL